MRNASSDRATTSVRDANGATIERGTLVVIARRAYVVVAIRERERVELDGGAIVRAAGVRVATLDERRAYALATRRREERTTRRLARAIGELDDGAASDRRARAVRVTRRTNEGLTIVGLTKTPSRGERPMTDETLDHAQYDCPLCGACEMLDDPSDAQVTVVVLIDRELSPREGVTTYVFAGTLDDDVAIRATCEKLTIEGRDENDATTHEPITPERLEAMYEIAITTSEVYE